MDSYKTYDKQFWIDYNQLLIDIDILYEEINRDKEYDEIFYEDLYEKNGLCYNITYTDEEDDDTDDEGTQYSYQNITFISKYHGYIDDIIFEIKDGLANHLVDSI